MKKSDFEFDSLFKKEVVRVMRKYRDVGATFQEIADRLNRDGIETSSGYGKWYAQTVHRWLTGKSK